MLGIHLEDLQLGNDTLGDREIEMFDDTLSLGEDGPITKQESEYTDVESNDIIQTSKKENYITSFTNEVSNIPNYEIKNIVKEMVDKTTGMFICDRCDYKTDVIRNGYTHLHRVHGNREYKCEKCDHKSKHKSHIKTHMETQHSGLRYDCDECEFQTAHKKDVKRHKLRKHNGGIKPFNCDLCTYRAVTANCLHDHKFRRHNVSMVTCVFCSYNSLTMRGLNIHIKNKHK